MASISLSMLLGSLLMAGAQTPGAKDAAGFNTVAPVVVTAARPKWATDAPLRVGMVDLQNAVVAEYFAACANGPTRMEYDRLADHLDDQSARIAAGSKVSGTPRAQLDVLLQEMKTSADLLKGSEDPQSGVRRTVGVLISYATDFNHPGWRPRHRGRNHSSAVQPLDKTRELDPTGEELRARAARLTLCKHLSQHDFSLWDR